MPEPTPSPKSRAGDFETEPEISGDQQVKHNYLLAIAVDHYHDPGISDLSNCVDDIEDLMAVLTRDYFFSAENIRYLRSRRREEGTPATTMAAAAEREQLERKFAHVGEATHEAIIRQLKILAKQITPADNLIICYSGHGIYDQDFNEGYWIPANGVLRNNASYVENSTIRTALNAIESHHTVLISDSCYSGTLFSAGKQRSLDIPRVYQYPSRWGLTAGRRNETVSDGMVGDNSPFARELIRILERKQEVWIGDLCKEIVTELTNRSEAQTPMGEPFADMKAHDGGQFVFLPRLASEIDYWRIAWRENTRKGYFAFLARYPNGEYENAALEALNVFSSAQAPAFSEAALETYNFLTEVLPERANTYLINYLKRTTTTELSKVAVELYRELLELRPAVAKARLKALILGRTAEDFPKIEATYDELCQQSPAAATRFLLDNFQPISANPYRGLAPYDHDISLPTPFFGRQVAIEALLGKLRGADAVLLSAPAYQGKTSVIHAGVYPRMTEYDLLPISPAAVLTHALEDLEQALDPDVPQLLVVDQFESLYTERHPPAERARFEQELARLLAKTSELKLKIIIALRSDYEPQFNASEFGQAFLGADSTVIHHLSAPTPNEMREMIQGPAWSRACEFESEELVDRMVEEVKYLSPPLPLLSFALYRFYEQLETTGSRCFTLAAFQEQLGGIHKALDRFADAIYQRLEPAAQRATRQVFLRMVQGSDGNYSTRRVVVAWATEDQLPGELDFPDPDHPEKIVELELAAGVYVLIDSGHDGRGNDCIEPIHELLITSWTRCLQWITDFGDEQIALQRDVWRAALAARQEQPGRARSFSRYWDNNPKLARMLDLIMGAGTQRLLTDPDGALAQGIEALGASLDKPNRLRFEKLMRNWREQGRPEHLDQFISIGASDQLLALFLRHGDHWLNALEIDFVKKSWAKRSEDITNLYRQRDEALAAKQQAETRQREITDLLRKSAIQAQAFKQQYREQTRREFHFIQAGFKPKLHLVLVGIDAYAKPGARLKSCVNDAKSIAEAFRGQESKLYEKVNIHLLTDAKATRQNIFDRVATVQRTAGMFDFVIVYLAGHGSLNKKEKDGIFIPFNFEKDNWIYGQEFCSELLRFESKVILIVDIVNGGDFLSTLAKANQSEDLDQLAHNVFGISSTSPGELAKEMRIDGVPRGVFSWALEQCLRTAVADLDGNGVVYLDEMLRYTSDIVREKVADQNVYAVVPATMPNIPLLQLGNTFSLPQREIALGRHIEDDAVIDEILEIYLPEKENSEAYWGYRLFAQGAYEELIDQLTAKISATNSRNNVNRLGR